MHGHDRDEAAMATSAGSYEHRAADEPIGDGEAWCRRAGFTEAEYRRLAFLRWLYRQGRLTEWC